MDKKYNAKGVALISAVIITIILLMLAGLTTYISTDIVFDAKEVAFAKNMQTISDAAQEYYSVNGSIPVLAGGTQFTASEYESAINSALGTSFSDALSDEIEENNDESATFYEIDISKLGIEDLSYGTKSDDYDFYLISADTNIIYYCRGFKVGGNIYFSNSYILKK